MNLIDFGFQQSNLFQHMPLFDEINYVGSNEEKVRKYVAVREDQPCQLLALNFIRKDEKILWDAVEDFLKRSTVNATGSVRGNFNFDLLTVDIHKEIKSFKHAELSAVIANNAVKLAPGQVRMVRYSSVYALLQKTIDGNWGKITFKSLVYVFNDLPDYLDLLVKRLLHDFQFPHDPVILLMNDLSQNPVFDSENDKQQSRLKDVIENLIPNSVEFIPEVYIQDKNGARELLSGCKL